MKEMLGVGEVVCWQVGHGFFAHLHLTEIYAWLASSELWMTEGSDRGPGSRKLGSRRHPSPSSSRIIEQHRLAR